MENENLISGVSSQYEYISSAVLDLFPNSQAALLFGLHCKFEGAHFFN